MTKSTNIQDLSIQIEKLVRDHIASIHMQAEAALARAFAVNGNSNSSKPLKPGRKGVKQRPASEIEALGEELFKIVSQFPGERMVVLAKKLDMSVHELRQPMVKLKKAGRIRSVGSNKSTKYFPLVKDAETAI